MAQCFPYKISDFFYFVEAKPPPSSPVSPKQDVMDKDFKNIEMNIAVLTKMLSEAFADSNRKLSEIETVISQIQNAATGLERSWRHYELASLMEEAKIYRDDVDTIQDSLNENLKIKAAILSKRAEEFRSTIA